MTGNMVLVPLALMIFLSILSVAYVTGVAQSIMPNDVIGSATGASYSGADMTINFPLVGAVTFPATYSFVNIAFAVGGAGFLVAVVGVGVVVSVVVGIRVISSGLSETSGRAVSIYVMLSLLWAAVSACAVVSLVGGTMTYQNVSHSIAALPSGLGIMLYFFLTVVFALGAVDVVQGGF